MKQNMKRFLYIVGWLLVVWTAAFIWLYIAFHAELEALL